MREAAAQPGAAGGPSASEAGAIVGLINAARRRTQIRYRLTFVATWLAVLGLLGIALAPNFDVPFVQEWLPFILGGIGMTVLISVSSILLAIVFAVLGALGRLSSRASIRSIATLYVSLVRGTPLLVQIIFVYLALPEVLPAAAKVPTLYLGVFALAFNYGAYMTEIFRAGIEAVPRGQREAAQALGMRESHIMRRVVMPQAVRIVIPAIGNEFIAMIKDSALVSVIGVQELLWRAQRAGAQDFNTFEALTIAALVYWTLTMIFSLFQDRLEKRMARGDR